MKKIDGVPINLRGLLHNVKYTVHYYQREYRWQEKQIQEMIDDLTSEFLGYYKPDHTRADVNKYGKYGVYFMGSVVLESSENAIIDGQQRLTSLTLLLMYLNNRLPKEKRYKMLEEMIFSDVAGDESFNINVLERKACMEAIFENRLETFDSENAPNESVKNLCARYRDIENIFSSKTDIPDDRILTFCEWLVQKVSFIKITAENDEDAHKIFVTMNDRGLNLTSLEMLKGYLLSKVEDDDKLKKFNDKWKKMVRALRKDNDKGDETFIRAWLRAQYAENIRDKKADVKSKDYDYDMISGQFHEWVHKKSSKLGLNCAADFEDFVEKIFYFAEIYLRILDAEKDFKKATEYIYYNAQVNFTLQPQMLLAPICYGDKPEVITEKINLTARFIDLLIIYRVLNKKSLAFNTIKDSIFNITKNIRRLTVKDLKTRLKDELQKYCDNMKLPDFAAALPDFGLNQLNKRYVKNILARVTSFIEAKSLVSSTKYKDYMKADPKNPYEIEHILCNHFERFKGEFSDEKDFDDWRNSIGALLLLPKKINASLNDANYPDKLPFYYAENIYAASLNEQAYQHNPAFKKFIAINNLSFKPFKKFGKAEIEQRVQLVMELANLIWNTEEFQ